MLRIKTIRFFIICVAFIFLFITNLHAGDEFRKVMKTIPLWIVPIGSVTIVVFGFVIAWNRRLRVEIKNRVKLQEQLESAEERSRLFLYSAGEGIFGVDLDGKINFVNPSAASLLGYKEEELINQAAHALIHHSHGDGTYYDVTDCPMYKSFTFGVSEKVMDEVLWRKDGTSFDVEYSSTPIKKNGKILGAVITFLDVTERKKAEATIKNKNILMNALIDSPKDVFILSLDKNYCYTAFNKNHYDFMQSAFSATIELGMNMLELMPSEIKNTVKGNFDNVLKGESYFEIQRQPDKPIWYEFNWNPIRANDQSVVGITAYVRDITQQRKLQKEIVKAKEEAERSAVLFREKEVQLSTAVNSMVGGIIMVDKDLNFQVSNEHFYELYNFPKEAGKKGKPFSSFLRMRAERGDYGSGDPEVLLADRLERYKNPEQAKKIEKYEDKIPGNRTAEVYIAPTEDGGFVFVINDITDRKMAESALFDSHKRITDSIEFASMIQSALLPEREIIKAYFSDSFMIWEPKDIVGGDIFFFEEIGKGKNEFLIFIIDCTGHGVPGAFVTALVKAVEQQAIAEVDNGDEPVSPAKILAFFNRNLKRLLKQEEETSTSNAGFDGGVLYYNKKEKILRYAGAETPLFLIQDQQIKIIRGDRHSIGYKKSDKNYRFKEHTIDVSTETYIYLTTDGFLDQNGGQKGYPFGKKQFKRLLLDHYQTSFSSQKLAYLEAIRNYRGDEEKNDDMTFIGLKIG